ncbi:hypothetical protein CC78DRAFT_584938 [Lojkania enalia]|uniref:DUF7514 domain-containing protein n=1 Tax=Lojkania enalia TaxID=147567 RepID=A0A9P4K6I1_9PLEO|nr:hypothetical protein CC78DRAFT_584938 [Didymosphaeria enalia]
MSLPPAPPYIPPSGAPQSSQSVGHDPQQLSQYQPTAPNYVPPHMAHKSSAGLGSMLNQAVTTSKPVLNKLSKTISSKLGSKPSSATPQHLQSYANYQQYYQQTQQGQQTQTQQFSPQPSQQQWQQSQNTYPNPSPQQSTFSQSNSQSSYATPTSGYSGQSGYFPQQIQTPPTPNTQTSFQQNALGYNPSQFTQGQNTGNSPPGQYNQGQFQYGKYEQGQPQGNGAQGQQQTGVIGGGQPQAPSVDNPGPVSSNIPTTVAVHPNQQPTSMPPTPGSDHANLANQNASPGPQQAQPFSPTPPPQAYGATPALPVHPSQQQQRWQTMSPSSPQASNQISSSSSPSPQTPSAPYQSPPNIQSQTGQQSYPTPPPQNTAPPAALTEFIAELPADIGKLNLGESSRPNGDVSSVPQSTSYQAYQPMAGQKQSSPAPGFIIPRRAVSVSNIQSPLADPWRIADPATELPTREFYIIADVIFDALDKKFEPQSTGLLEASKLLQCWKAQELGEEAAQLFSYNNYTAFAKLWSLTGIPHLLVPCQPTLMPIWNFQAQSHSKDMGVPAEGTQPNATYPEYMPALNRAGWCKYLFVEVICEPESLAKMLSLFCVDTYKPGILNHPDIQKQDRSEVPALTARATATRTMLKRVFQEVAAAMQAGQSSGVAPEQPTARGMTPQEAALRMQNLQIQSQTNAQANAMMMNGGTSFATTAGGWISKPAYYSV